MTVRRRSCSEFPNVPDVSRERSGPAAEIAPHLRPEILALERPASRKRPGFLNLSSNELGHPACERLAEEFLATASPRLLSVYPDPAAFIRFVAGHADLAEDSVLLTAGSDDAIRMVMALLGAGTRRLILQHPNYENYSRYAAVFGVECRLVAHTPRSPGEFSSALRIALATGAPALVVIANPNGFSGYCYPLSEVAGWEEECQRHGHLLVIDEAYGPFAPIDHTPLLRQSSRVVLVRSFSKSFGMAGMRLGMVASSPDTVAYLARWQSGNPVNGLALAFMRHCMANTPVIEGARRDIIDTRGWLQATVTSALPWMHPFPSQANFVLVDVGTMELRDRLACTFEAERIRIRSMAGTDGYETCLRFSVHHRPVMERVLALLDDSAPR